MCVLITQTNTENIMEMTKIKPLKNKCPVCLEYYTGYVDENGKLLNSFCSFICKKQYENTLRPRKIKKLISNINGN